MWSLLRLSFKFELLGPMAHLVYGVHEQNYVAHVMAHAACMGPYKNGCDVPGRSTSSAITVQLSIWLFCLALLLSNFPQ